MARKPTAAQVAKAEAGAALVEVTLADGTTARGQWVANAPAPKSSWVRLEAPCGREVQGCIVVIDGREAFSGNHYGAAQTWERRALRALYGTAAAPALRAPKAAA